jgi:HSP20 family molecular chaperone IbpA
MIYNPRRDLFSLFDSLFFSFPERQTKPPIDNYPIERKDDTGLLDGWMIQMALAGFTDKDVKVWTTGQTLFIQGDNSENSSLSDRFCSTFSHQIKLSDKLDPTKAEVTLENGILSIKIPLTDKPPANVTTLFGNHTKSLSE